MIYQLFHRHKTTNELILAGQSGDIETNEQMKTWERAVAEEMPLPDDYRWLLCNSKSKHFNRKAILKAMLVAEQKE